MMTRLFRLISSLIAASLLVACGSSPPVNFYHLDATDSAAVVSPEGELALLAIGPVRVPDYLTRPQLVTRGPGASMIVDDFNRWAEPLDHAVHRVVAINVDSQISELTVVAFPYSSLVNADYRLLGSIERFDVDQGGQAVLVVQWGISDMDGNLLVSPRRSRYTTTAASNSSNSVVQAMSQIVADFSRDIAGEMRTVISANQAP